MLSGFALFTACVGWGNISSWSAVARVTVLGGAGWTDGDKRGRQRTHDSLQCTEHEDGEGGGGEGRAEMDGWGWGCKKQLDCQARPQTANCLNMYLRDCPPNIFSPPFNVQLDARRHLRRRPFEQPP